MNILPKKRWHVRTKENIARVRRDEAEAAEKERQEKIRIETADREARINVLKHKSKQNLLESGIIETAPNNADIPTEHVNLFEDLDNAVQTTNKEHDKEVKEKTEDYEKKIGYLTYLGQDTNETLGKKNWYEVAPGSSRFSRSSEIKDTYDKLVLKDAEGKPKTKELDVKNGEINWKAKQRLDPINTFKKYCQQKEKNVVHPSSGSQISMTQNKDIKHKNKCNKPNDKQEKIKKLREARLKRELQEKHRTDLFLTKLNAPKTSNNNEQSDNRIKPKYNSQFNPELARQNYR